MSLQEYREFIANRAVKLENTGFKADALNAGLKVHQRNQAGANLHMAERMSGDLFA